MTKKYLIRGIISVFVLLGAYLYYLKQQYLPDTREQTVFLQRVERALKDDKTEIPLTDLTDFDWDRVSIAGSYACPSYSGALENSDKALSRNKKIEEVNGHIGRANNGDIVVSFPWCGMHGEVYATALFLRGDEVVGVVRFNAFKLAEKRLDKAFFGRFDSTGKIHKLADNSLSILTSEN